MTRETHSAAPSTRELTGGGWVERSRPGANKTTVRWRERGKPGQPGVLERVYIDSEDRTSTAIGTAGLAYGSTRPASSRTAPAARTASTKPIAVPHIKTVTLTAWARRQLDDLDYDSLYETGGGLFGNFDARTGELVIDGVTGGVTDATEASASLDFEWISQMAVRHRECGRELVGNVHSHPRYCGERALPSDADRACWRSWVNHGGGRAFTGVIISPAAENHGWIHPRLSAYVPNQQDDFDYLPVTVEPEEVPLWRR